MRVLVLFIFSLFVLSGCMAAHVPSSPVAVAKAAEKSLGGCSRPWPTGGTYCEEQVSTSGSHDVETRKQVCETLGGTFSPSGCNRAVAVGLCEAPDMNSLRGTHFYPDTIEPATASAICRDDNGRFTSFKN